MPKRTQFKIEELYGHPDFGDGIRIPQDSEFKTELLWNSAYLTMCPDIVVFETEDEIREFSYYYPPAIVCKLLLNVDERDITDITPLGAKLHYSNPEIGRLYDTLRRLAYIYKGKQFHISDAIRTLYSKRPHSIADAIALANVWAEGTLRAAVTEQIGHHYIQSPLFERSQRRAYNPDPVGSAYITNQSAYIANMRLFDDGLDDQ